MGRTMLFRCSHCGQLAFGDFCMRCHIEDKIEKANGRLVLPPEGDERGENDPSIFHIRYRAAQLRRERKMFKGPAGWSAIPRIVKIIHDPMLDE